MKNPFLDKKLEECFYTSWDITDKALSKINSCNIKFTYKEKNYNVRTIFGCENEFAPAYYWDGKGNGDNYKIYDEFIEDSKIINAVKNLGLSSEKAEIEILKFTPLDRMMYEIHSNNFGLLEFNFGNDYHGRGYYDTPPNKEIGIKYGTPEVRLKPNTTNSFLNNYNKLVTSLAESFNKFSFTPSKSSNHVNFSLWIKNDGTFDDYKPALSRNGKFVNLFVLANEVPEAKIFLKNALNGVINTFNEMEFFENSTNKYAIEHNLGTSRANSFRLCENRCEYRYGKGLRENMNIVAMQIVKGIEMGISKNLYFDDLVYEKDACKIHFHDEYSENKDLRLFTRRMLESSELIKQNDGSYSFSPDLYYYSKGYGTKVDNELFGINHGLSITGESSATFSNHVIHELFGNIKLQNGSINYQQAIEYMRSKNEIFSEENISRFSECMSSIKTVEVINIVGTEKLESPVKPRNLSESLIKFVKSKSLESTFKDLTPDLIKITVSAYFSNNLYFKCLDCDNHENVEKNLNNFGHELELILKDTPPKNRIHVIEGTKDALNGLKHFKNLELYERSQNLGLENIETLNTKNSNFIGEITDKIISSNIDKKNILLDDTKELENINSSFLNVALNLTEQLQKNYKITSTNKSRH